MILLPHRFLVLALVLAGCSDDAGPTGGAGARPNVLVLTLDTTRADRLGCYGHADAHTPHLDALAARGARFEWAYAPVPLTLPSHATLWTGLQPPEHGIHDNGRVALPAEVPHAAQTLRAAGWATAAFVSASVLDSAFGLERGFDLYDDRLSAVDADGDTEPPQRSAAATTDAALAWMAGAAEPFLSWVHYYDPHSTYDPPPPWRQRMKDPYDGEIAYVDEQVGRILAALEARGILQRTLVVVVADHGESLGEHQERTHGVFIYDATMRVPLIVAGPGCDRTVVPTPVEMADLAPTILELCGVPAIGSGRSLRPALRGKPLEPRPIYTESLYGWLAFGWSPLYGNLDDGWRYIHSSVPELYDRVRDPREIDDAIAREPERAASLAAGLEQLRARFQTRAAEAARIDPALAARMQDLGYVQSAQAPAELGDLAGLRPPREMIRVLDDFSDGVGFTQHGHPEKGIALLERARDAWPRGSQIRMHLGMTYHLAGRHAEALVELGEALALDPTLEQAHYFVGLAHSAEGRLDDAVAAFDRALALRPEAHLPRAGKAWSLVRLDRREEAIVCLREVVGLKPRHLEYAMGLARLLREAGRAAEAVAVLSDAHARRPEEAGFALYLAWELATNPDDAARDGRRAVEIAERALAVRGRSAPDDLDTLAAAYAEAGRFDAAVATAEEALRSAGPGTDAALIAEWQARRDLYRAKQAFRDR